MDRRILLSLILIFAFLIRMQNFGEIFDSQIYYYEYDPYYHMRLVEIIVKEGYRPSYDYYLNYPYGLRVDWLPFFDYILAFPGILLGLEASEIFAVLFPVILGVLSTLLIYLISLEIVRNEKFAIISAFIYSVTPVAVWRSVLGFADHHSWVVFLLLLSIYFLLKPGTWKALSGIPMLLMAFSWLGTPIYAAILAISSLIYFNVKELRLLAISNLVPALSFIQNHYLGLSFLALSIFLLIGSYVKGYEERIKSATIYYLLTSLLCILIAYFTPLSAFDFLRSGINYVFGIDIYLPTISEAKSFQILDLISSSGYVFFFLALVSILMLRNKFLLVFFLLSFALSLLQLRFAEVLAIPSAILASYTICNVLERLEYPV
ncbi:MAG: STT3 domain-containing protein, partial [Archaeoglobaceae archaeon]